MMKDMLTESTSLVEDVSMMNYMAKLSEMHTSIKRSATASLRPRIWDIACGGTYKGL